MKAKKFSSDKQLVIAKRETITLWYKTEEKQSKYEVMSEYITNKIIVKKVT